MNNSKNNDGISDERLEEIRKSLFVDLRKTLIKDINDKIKGSVSDYIGAMLDFPLTIRQAARLMGHSESNVYKMCQRGIIPYTKKGGKVHVNIKDISSALILGEETTE